MSILARPISHKAELTSSAGVPGMLIPDIVEVILARLGTESV